MGKLVSRGGALNLIKETFKADGIAEELVEAFNKFHAMNIYDDYSIEKQVLEQTYMDVERITVREPKDPNVIIFNPSGASKCARELFYKITRAEEDKGSQIPFQKRWTRNSTAVHEVIQKDLLYMDKYLRNYHFRVAKAEEIPDINIPEDRKPFPAWENNILTTRYFTHNGYYFGIRGMMDGNLIYTPTDELIGFEIKTKSTTIASVGDYKLKQPMDSHTQQCICYSVLFRGDPYEERTDRFIIFYESVAKDNWNKGASARADIKAFEVSVEKADRIRLLDKFAQVCEYVENGELPPQEFDKCLFCKYKGVCGVTV